MAGSLTQAQCADYARNGYLSPIDVLTLEEAADQRTALEKAERYYRDGVLPRPIKQYLRMNAHLTNDFSLKSAQHPKILNAVESILGPDVMLWSCEYFIKESKSRQIVSWHQDLTYWGMDGTDHEVTAWLALSPASAQSGCMKFVPCSHTEDLAPHQDTFAENNMLSRGQEIAVDVDEADAVHAELRTGQMSLHHGRMFHSSGPNLTDDRRIGFVMRFIRPDTPAVGKDFAMLMRGVDRVGNRLNIAPETGRDFTDSRLALYEEVQSTVNQTLAIGLNAPTAMYVQGTAENA